MQISSFLIFLCSFLFFSVISESKAQETFASQKKQPLVHFFTGYSPESMLFWGSVPDTELFTFGANIYSHVFNWGKYPVYYSFGASFVHINFPTPENIEVRQSADGFGVSPIGLFLPFERRKPITPFVSSTGGFVLFNKPFPNEDGRNINFEFKLSFGLKTQFAGKTGLSFAYTFHHISNGGSGDFNPGLDSNVMSVSFLF